MNLLKQKLAPVGKIRRGCKFILLACALASIATVLLLPAAAVAQSATSDNADSAIQKIGDTTGAADSASEKRANATSARLTPSADDKTKSSMPSKAADVPNSTRTEISDGKKDEDAVDEIIRLKAQLSEQQRQIDELRERLEKQEKLTAQKNAREDSSLDHTGQPKVETANPALASVKSEGVASKPAPQKTDEDEPSPLSFRIGSSYLTPIGFMDFTTVFRSTNVGSGIGTHFGGIPFNNTAAGKLSEVRLSAQNSRIGLRIDAKIKDAYLIGYFESDFLGFAPGNVAVTSNSNSNRMRLFWVDVKKEKFEFLGGQSWSLLTPNRKGLSPIPSDVFYTQDVDTNYQAGLVWSRDAQFRIVYHPRETIALGVSLENPEQYIGGSAGASAITLPSALASLSGTELSNGNATLAAPNLHPDIVAKIAFDPKLANRDLHIEVGGVLRSFRIYNTLNQNHYTATGGGGSLNLNLEIVKNFRFVSNNFYSDGGGRYIFGLAPDLIVRGDGSLSLIHSGSTVTGFEFQANKNLLLYGYYGGTYIRRNVAIDPANGKFIGYGYAGSPASQYRNIQEATIGFNETFWKDPRYGALQLITQYSYLLKTPYYVGAGLPRNAHTNLFFIDLRYVLPGAASKIK